MEVSEKIKVVKTLVEDYYFENAEWCNVDALSERERRQVISIATSILCTMWNIGPSSGGFVQQFVNNNLMGALSNADSTTFKGLQFFSKLVYNTAKPSQL